MDTYEIIFGAAVITVVLVAHSRDLHTARKALQALV